MWMLFLLNRNKIYYLFDPLKEGLRGKHYASDEEGKTAKMKWLSFKGETLLLRETVTMLRSRDVIHKGPVSFWCMMHVPVSIIISVLKKKALLFDFPSYVYIYILPGVAVPPWATETVLSPLDGGWCGHGIARAFTRCMMKKKNWLQDLALNDPQGLICHKTIPNQTLD